MTSINPKKLLNSKWTAVSPQHKEKHFIITKVTFSDEGLVAACLIEAVMTKRSSHIDWQDLKNNTLWLQGWQ